MDIELRGKIGALLLLYQYLVSGSVLCRRATEQPPARVHCMSAVDTMLHSHRVGKCRHLTWNCAAHVPGVAYIDVAVREVAPGSTGDRVGTARTRAGQEGGPTSSGSLPALGGVGMLAQEWYEHYNVNSVDSREVKVDSREFRSLKQSVKQEKKIEPDCFKLPNSRESTSALYRSYLRC